MKNMLKMVVLALFLALSGCSVIQQGGDNSKNSNTSNTTFVYSYDKDGKPVEAARVRNNGKIAVQVKNEATGEFEDTEIDAGGWILIKPTSPLLAKKPSK